MTISIVTISYNQAEFLSECIESVINQRTDCIEYIMVDPGSTDDSRDIIQSYKDRIDKIIFEPDRGPADGLNKGFSEATGEVFGYINADDFLLPGALEYIEATFTSRPYADVLYGDGLLVDEKGNVTRKLLSTPWNFKAYLYGGCSIVQQSTFFRRSVFECAGRFNIDNHTCWDGELITDMALSGARIYNYKETTGAFRVYPGSISGSGRLNSQYYHDKNRIFINAIAKQGYKLNHHTLKFYYKFWKWFKRPNLYVFKNKLRV